MTQDKNKIFYLEKIKSKNFRIIKLGLKNYINVQNTTINVTTKGNHDLLYSPAMKYTLILDIEISY